MLSLIVFECQYVKICHAEGIMLSVVMLSGIMLKDIMLSDIMQILVVLSVIMSSAVIRLNDSMLSHIV